MAGKERAALVTSFCLAGRQSSAFLCTSWVTWYERAEEEKEHGKDCDLGCRPPGDSRHPGTARAVADHAGAGGPSGTELCEAGGNGEPAEHRGHSLHPAPQSPTPEGREGRGASQDQSRAPASVAEGGEAGGDNRPTVTRRVSPSLRAGKPGGGLGVSGWGGE